MKKIIRRKIEMGDRVVEIGGHPDLNPTAGITAIITQVGTVVTNMKEGGSSQASGFGAFRGGAQQCRFLAREIRTMLLDISTIAKVIPPVDLPGASELFRMPSASASFQSLLASARHFAEDVEPHKALFIARALPATFVDDLEAKIAVFESAIGQKANGRATRISGTSSMALEAKKLMSLVKELRAILRVHLKSNPALHDAWKSAARVDRSSPAEAEAPAVPGDGGGDSGSGSGGTVVVS